MLESKENIAGTELRAASRHKGKLVLVIVLMSAVTSLVTFWISSRSGFWTAADYGSAVQYTETPVTSSEGSTSLHLDTAKSDSIAAMTLKINELENMLEQEQNGRLMLQRTLSDQEKQLEKLNAEIQALAQSSADDLAGSDQIEAHRAAGVADQGGEAAPMRRVGAGFRQPPTADVLVEAGVDESVALELIARQDSRALAELEIRDQAAREGWLDAEDFEERLEASLPERVNLRDTLEPDQWDRYLYSSGRPNRVAITGILNGSAAYNALLQTGDQLLSYAGQPIYRIGDLQSGTRAGNKGEMVVVRVMRGTDVLELTVPRGPLGVNLSPERVDPAESRVNP